MKNVQALSNEELVNEIDNREPWYLRLIRNDLRRYELGKELVRRLNEGTIEIN